jgi:hypothetical protein
LEDDSAGREIGLDQGAEQASEIQSIERTKIRDVAQDRLSGIGFGDR